MDFSRIEHVIDVATMATRAAVVVGVGGGANLCRNLVRCGLGRSGIVDMDTVGAENICRQEHMADQLGLAKVDALAAELRRINPAARVESWRRNFCDFTDEEVDRHFGDADLFVFCVDNLAANARGNEAALRLSKPALWSGLYPQGRAGEVVFWRPGLASCYRCLCAARYEAHAGGRLQAAPSDGADVLAVQLLDSVAGMVAVGLLTEGADNRYGRMIRQLGDRNFLQIKIDPDWGWGGQDVVRRELGIPENRDTYFSFCSIARRDPDPGGRCPDCLRYRLPRAAA
jgi:hypothetical protein